MRSFFKQHHYTLPGTCDRITSSLSNWTDKPRRSHLAISDLWSARDARVLSCIQLTVALALFLLIGGVKGKQYVIKTVADRATRTKLPYG